MHEKYKKKTYNRMRAANQPFYIPKYGVVFCANLSVF